MQENEDERQFFRDLGATAEQAVEEARGFEENYQSWTAGIMQKLHGYAEQDFGAAFVFARELSQAKDFSDLTRIQMDYLQNCSELFMHQAKDLALTCTKLGLGTITPPFGPQGANGLHSWWRS
jgi:Phasin protein